MPRFRLLALDMDGTIIDRELRIRPRVEAAIRAATEAGVAVTLATGRMVRTTKPFADFLNLETPLICYQGAHVQAPDGRVLHSMDADPQAASELVGEILARDIYIQAYVNDELWIAAERPELDEYRSFSTVPLPINIEPNLGEFVRENPPTKLLWICEPATLEPLLAKLEQTYQNRLSIFRSHDRFGEAANPDSSKGVALAKLAEALGIPQAQVMAIGDRQNDAPMLAWAGLGFAMGDADDYAREAADEYLPSFREDGAAIAIERWILEAE